MRFPALFPVLLLAADLALADVGSFEGTSEIFPDQQGWTRQLFCTPERSFQQGWFVHSVDVGECGPPPPGDTDAYTLSIGEMEIFSDAFFVEVFLETDGPRSEIVGQAPAVVAAASFGPVTYRWTIARDQVKLFRDALLPRIFLDIEPDVPHRFRLEVFGSELYRWYIDGAIVDSGIPEGEYPSATPFVGWQARASQISSVTRWRYLRFGRIPIDASGDFDSSGAVDEFDVFYFDECVTRSAEGEPAVPSCDWADMDADTDVDCGDWTLFQLAWTGLGDPPTLSACLVVDPIPTVSTWGLVVMALLTLTAGSLVFKTRYHPSSHVHIA